MPTASEVVRQYARYYAAAFDLDIARPVFEGPADLTIVTGRITVLPRRLNCAAAANPDQSTYNDRGDVEPFQWQLPPDVAERDSLNRGNTQIQAGLLTRLYQNNRYIIRGGKTSRKSIDII